MRRGPSSIWWKMATGADRQSGNSPVDRGSWPKPERAAITLVWTVPGIGRAGQRWVWFSLAVRIGECGGACKTWARPSQSGHLTVPRP